MKLRFWENWNTRTQSTVQYVGVSEWSESGRSALPREEEEDDDDADDALSVGDNPAGVEEERESGPSAQLLESERSPEAAAQREGLEEGGKRRSVALRDVMRYEAYWAFPARLKGSAFETEASYECGASGGLRSRRG